MEQGCRKQLWVTQEVAVAVEWQGLPITTGIGWSGCQLGMEQSKPKTAEAKGCLGLRDTVSSMI